jgi:hypothetical protein
MISSCPLCIDTGNYYLQPVCEEDFKKLPKPFCFDNNKTENVNLDEFFQETCFLYESAHICKTYKLVEKIDDEIISLISLENSILRIEGYENRPSGVKNIATSVLGLPDEYPAIKIKALGVLCSKQKSDNRIGTLTLNMIKCMFRESNRTGCRFIILYAIPSAVEFYEKNKFQLVEKDTNTDLVDGEKVIEMYCDLFSD